jgi:hypothetical protein
VKAIKTVASKIIAADRVINSFQEIMNGESDRVSVSLFNIG